MALQPWLEAPLLEVPPDVDVDDKEAFHDWLRIVLRPLLPEPLHNGPWGVVNTCSKAGKERMGCNGWHWVSRDKKIR